MLVPDLLLTEMTAPEVRPYSAGAFVVRARNESIPSGEGRGRSIPVEPATNETPSKRISLSRVRLPLMESWDVFTSLAAPPCVTPGINASKFSVVRSSRGRFWTSEGAISVETSEVVASSCSPFDSTITVSVTAPNCRFMLTEVTCATDATRLLTTDCLRPAELTTTR